MTQQFLTAAQIIASFELQVNDITELATDQEYQILNRVYLKVCADRPYEFLKSTASGNVNTDAIGSFIPVPANFTHFATNNAYTDNSIAVQNNAAPKVIFIVNGVTYQPYQIINFSDRRQYINRSGYAYLDIVNNVIRFTMPPVAGTYEFDYIITPELLTSADSPIFPGRFHEMLMYGMAVENDIIQLSPKATSYAQDNQARFDSYKLDMQYWNANLQLN